MDAQRFNYPVLLSSALVPMQRLIDLNSSLNFAFFSGLVLQTDENSNVRVKLEMWNDDPKQLWDFVPVGKKTTSEERISLLSTTTEI